MNLNDLQAMLVRLAILSVDQIRRAVAVTKGTAITWIEALLVSGQLDDGALLRCIAQRTSLPVCDFPRMTRVSKRVLDCLPADLCIEHRVVPVQLEPDGDLSVAMIDPTDHLAVEELAFFSGRHVLREVGRATAIAHALHAHYRGENVLRSSHQQGRESWRGDCILATP